MMILESLRAGAVQTMLGARGAVRKREWYRAEGLFGAS
jgi:hypothetical protein